MSACFTTSAIELQAFAFLVNSSAGGLFQGGEKNFIPCIDKVRGHGRAHDAEADESKFAYL